MTRTWLSELNGAFPVLLLPFLLATAVQSPAYSQAKSYQVEEGIVYSVAGGVELELDIAWPVGKTGPFPAVIFFPGNGWGWWQSESRNAYYLDIRQAAKRGYVAAAADYRLTSVKENNKTKFNFPAQLHDVKAAIRWLRLNAAKYSIDAARIGAVGFSSGAHLALMLGLTVPSDGFEGTLDLSIPSNLQAVVSIAGPTDLTSVYNESQDPKQIFINLLGCTPNECPDRYLRASPLSYVRTDAPPVLIIHGDKDVEIPVRQALILDEKMRAVGAPHRLVIVKGGRHENILLGDDIWKFLDDNLRR